MKDLEVKQTNTRDRFRDSKFDGFRGVRSKRRRRKRKRKRRLICFASHTHSAAEG